jgi:Leucine-rich repeat (LRR) protein
MKNIVLILVLIFGLQNVNAQYVTIPDANFRTALKALYPSCFNASNKFDTTCTAIVSAFDIDVNNKNIVSIHGIQYFKNLQYLNCSYNTLTTLSVLPNSIQRLYCSHNQLTTIPSLPSELRYLSVTHNQLTSLPVLPVYLYEMHCDSNQLNSLPALPSISTLYCQNNNLISLPSLPSSLHFLNCNNNQLSSLPPLPASLDNLYSSYNQLTELPTLPEAMVDLYCSSNRLTRLPRLPSMHRFDCSKNQLSSIPTLSKMFLFLCSGNQLTTLPSLPNALQYLDCSYNQLIELPVLDSGLTSLICNNNKITILPPLPSLLSNLNCSKNLLTTLPVFPSTMQLIRCTDNKITCLPVNRSLFIYAYLKRTLITCKPPNSYLVVDTTLNECTNPLEMCPTTPFIKGLVYNDLNNNEILDSVSEPLISGQIIKVSPADWLGSSTTNGTYWIIIDTSTNNSWTLINNHRYATVTPTIYTKNPHDTLGLISGSYDFGFHFMPNVYDLETTLASSPARPGFTTNITVTANNVGTVNQSNITIKFKKPNGFNVLSTSIAATTTVNDTLIWNNISINYLEHQSINIQLQVPVNAVLGDSAVYEAWSNGTQGDSTPIDNYTKWTEIIRGSFDPNDKLVNKASLQPTYNAEKDRLLYTIRFQNTGTDTAFTVIVRDVIPDNLDVSSLRVVNASHKYQLIVREKNIIEVTFPNIQLPDSNANEAKSHGFVQLEFKPKAGLPLNAEINNNASILFDYNAPVVTNTATTKIQITTGIANNKKLAFKLFPNPATSIITVELPFEGNGKWYLMDISGKSIQQNTIENNLRTFDINVNDVSSGTYLLTLEINGIISTSKVAILK